MPSFTSTFLYVSAALIGATSAFPVEARSCQISYPTSMVEVTPLETPDHILTDFCIASNQREKYVEFGDIPTNARGACQLEFYFPAAYNVGTSGNPQVNVWKTERAFGGNDTFSNGPKLIANIGPVNLNSKLNEASRLVVNSGGCDTMKHFKFAMATAGSSVNYAESAGYAGVRIVHSC